MLKDTIINRLSSGSTWKGQWVDGTAYVTNDLVQNDGSTYIATQDHISSPATEPGDGTAWTTVWDIVAAKGEKGDKGDPGQDGADGEDGESFIWRGLWSDSSSYIINDVVYNNGSSYIATQDHDASPSTEPGDGTAWIVVWDLMAARGEKGDQGEQGEKGDKGDTGDQGPPGEDGIDGQDGVYDRCDELIMEMEMEFKTTYLCYYKAFTYTNKMLSELDIYSDATAGILIFHKDFYYNTSKQLIRTELTRISDNALLISEFDYDNRKNLVSIERSGYCSCSSSSSSSTSSSSSSRSSSSSSRSSSSSSSKSSSSSSSSSKSSSSTSTAQGTFTVTANADDGFVTSTYINNTDGETGFGDYPSTVNKDAYMRYTNITIPSGATITSCYLRVYASRTITNSTVRTKIACDWSDDSPQITSHTDYHSRTDTEDALGAFGYVDWNPVPGFIYGNWYETPDFSSVVQYIIDRGGWNSGQAIQVYIKDNNSSNGAERRFGAQVNQWGSQLHITWY